MPICSVPCTGEDLTAAHTAHSQAETVEKHNGLLPPQEEDVALIFHKDS